MNLFKQIVAWSIIGSIIFLFIIALSPFIAIGFVLLWAAENAKLPEDFDIYGGY